MIHFFLDAICQLQVIASSCWLKLLIGEAKHRWVIVVQVKSTELNFNICYPRIVFSRADVSIPILSRYEHYLYSFQSQRVLLILLL